MKLSSLAVIHGAAIGLLGVAAAVNEAPSFIRGGTHGRELGGPDLDYLRVKYEDGECWIEYKVHGYDDTTIDLPHIDEDHDQVTCWKNDKEAEEGLGPHFEKDLLLRDASYSGEVVRDADVLWDDDKLEVTIKTFKHWKATYDPKAHRKCRLEYKYGDKPTEIKFKNRHVEVDGNKVTCQFNHADGKLPTGDGHRLIEIDYDLSRHEIDAACGEAKGGNVKWEVDEPLVLTLEIDHPDCDDQEEEITEEDFEDLDLTYDGEDVILEYEIDGITDSISFPESSVERDPHTGEVTFSMCEEPPEGVPLPWDIDFDVHDVTYVTRCGHDDPELLVQVEEATLTWEYDDSCGDSSSSEDTDGRHLRRRRKARARGNIKARGRK